MKDSISRTQLTALVWMAALAPAAELLPALTLPIAGRGAWLAPLAASPLVLLSGWLFGALAGSRGLPAEARTILGRGPGNVVLLLYIVWGELLLSLRLRLCAQRLLDGGRRDGPLWYFLLGVAAVVLWMGLGRVSAFARAGQIFLAVLLTTGAVVMVLSLRGVRPERTLPLWSGDVRPVLSAALPTAGALGWGMYGAFLTGHMERRAETERWHWLSWGLGGCILLTVAQWIMIGNLGPALAARLDNAFFSLAKSVGVEGAFQRVEGVIVALWTLADITLGAMLLLTIRIMVKEVASKSEERSNAVFALVLAVILALMAFPDGRAERWNRELVPVVHAILGLCVPLALWLIQKLSIYSSRAGRKRDEYRRCRDVRKKV